MKKRIIFVGCFLDQNRTGGVGGQMFACKSLIASELSEDIEWLKIDSTATTNLARPFYQRAMSAFFRVCRLTFLLVIKRKVDKVLIFTSSGLSFIEKGTMVLISNLIFRKQVILAPRSGRMILDLQLEHKKRFIEHIFRRSEYVICQEKYWEQLFISAFPKIRPKKYMIIKNWLNIDKINAIEPVYASKEVVQILFLGWLEIDKGIYDLLEAAIKLIGNNIPFKLIIAGEGKDEEGLLQKIRDNKLEKYIETPGWIKGQAKLDLLGESDIFVLPTYYEGSPNALIEAMALGLPSIATKAGGIPDLIEHGHDGYLIDTGNISALYEYLLLLVEDAALRKTIGSAARETIRQYHTVDSAIPKFKKILLDQEYVPLPDKPRRVLQEEP